MDPPTLPVGVTMTTPSTTTRIVTLEQQPMMIVVISYNKV